MCSIVYNNPLDRIARKCNELQILRFIPYMRFTFSKPNFLYLFNFIICYIIQTVVVNLLLLQFI